MEEALEKQFSWLERIKAACVCLIEGHVVA